MDDGQHTIATQWVYIHAKYLLSVCHNSSWLAGARSLAAQGDVGFIKSATLNQHNEPNSDIWYHTIDNVYPFNANENVYF